MDVTPLPPPSPVHMCNYTELRPTLECVAMTNQQFLDQLVTKINTIAGNSKLLSELQSLKQLLETTTDFQEALKIRWKVNMLLPLQEIICCVLGKECPHCRILFQTKFERYDIRSVFSDDDSSDNESDDMVASPTTPNDMVPAVPTGTDTTIKISESACDTNDADTLLTADTASATDMVSSAKTSNMATNVPTVNEAPASPTDVHTEASMPDDNLDELLISDSGEETDQSAINNATESNNTDDTIPDDEDNDGENITDAQDKENLLSLDDLFYTSSLEPDFNFIHSVETQKRDVHFDSASNVFVSKCARQPTVIDLLTVDKNPLSQEQSRSNLNDGMDCCYTIKHGSKLREFLCKTKTFKVNIITMASLFNIIVSYCNIFKLFMAESEKIVKADEWLLAILNVPYFHMMDIPKLLLSSLSLADNRFAVSSISAYIIKSTTPAEILTMQCRIDGLLDVILYENKIVRSIGLTYYAYEVLTNIKRFLHKNCDKISRHVFQLKGNQRILRSVFGVTVIHTEHLNNILLRSIVCADNNPSVKRKFSAFKSNLPTFFELIKQKYQVLSERNTLDIDLATAEFNNKVGILTGHAALMSTLQNNGEIVNDSPTSKRNLTFTGQETVIQDIKMCVSNNNTAETVERTETAQLKKYTRSATATAGPTCDHDDTSANVNPAMSTADMGTSACISATLPPVTGVKSAARPTSSCEPSAKRSKVNE